MNIYRILDDIKQNIVCQHRKRHLQKHHPDLFDTLTKDYPITTNTPFTEICYIVENKLTDTPKCHCGNYVTWNVRIQDYHTFCSQPCSIHIANEVARTDEVKQKRRTTMEERYGYSNYFQSDKGRKESRRRRIEYWNKHRPILDDDFEDYKLYYKNVWLVTNRSYAEHKDNIDPDRLRGSEYHLDHRFSIMAGFFNKVPAQVIGHYENLEILPWKDNLSKGFDSSITLSELSESVDFAVAGEEIIPKRVLSTAARKASSERAKKNLHKTVNKQVICEHCGWQGNKGNYAQHHGPQCKKNG